MIESAARRALEETLAERVQFDVPMSKHTSLRVGGPADAFAQPANRDELAALLAVCAAHGLPTTPLGAGFNTMVLDGGLDGVVVSTRKLRRLELGPDGRVDAEAGVSHRSVINFCSERGLSGLEFAAGIPGTVGGWIAMNAGIGSREMVDVVCAVDVMRPDGSACDRIERDTLHFRYRGLDGLAAGSVIVAVSFETTPSTPEAVRAEVDRKLAARAATQPLDVPSCGSVFKNPESDFAGRLIEAAGLKGAREGGAQISPVHANFIANLGGGVAADVLALIERARSEVARTTGIELETEVEILGRKP